MLNTKQVAEKLGVHPKTVWLWIKQGQIKSVKLGRNFKISETEVQYVLENGLRKAD